MTTVRLGLPADPNNYNLRADSGRVHFDRRHRLTSVGNYKLGYGFRLGAIVKVSVGPYT